MANILPTSKEIFYRNIAAFESYLNQTIPSFAKSFVRVLSAIDALNYTELYKYGYHGLLQNLALTAGETALEKIGEEYQIIRIKAEAFEGTAETEAATGTAIEVSTDYVGDLNFERYFPKARAVAVDDLATFDLKATKAGAAGNLEVGNTLTIGHAVAGASSIATITAVLNVGAEKENIEVYRARVLTRIRSVGGGGNSSDHRRWGSEVAGITGIFPYSGRELVAFLTANDIEFDHVAGNDDQILSTTTDFVAEGIEDDQLITFGGTTLNNITVRVFGVTANAMQSTVLVTDEAAGADVTFTYPSIPGDRIVFVECSTDIDPDGIPPAALLEEVRQAILYDPDTGEARSTLGDLESMLYVRPITRTGFYVEVRGLTVDPALLTSTKTKIDAAFETYFRTIRPYISGLDPLFEKNNVITDPAVSDVLQDILETVGGSARGVGFGDSPSTFLGEYTLGQGETAKLVSVTYID